MYGDVEMEKDIIIITIITDPMILEKHLTVDMISPSEESQAVPDRNSGNITVSLSWETVFEREQS